MYKLQEFPESRMGEISLPGSECWLCHWVSYLQSSSTGVCYCTSKIGTTTLFTQDDVACTPAQCLRTKSELQSGESMQIKFRCKMSPIGSWIWTRGQPLAAVWGRLWYPAGSLTKGLWTSLPIGYLLPHGSTHRLLLYNTFDSAFSRWLIVPLKPWAPNQSFLNDLWEAFCHSYERSNTHM